MPGPGRSKLNPFRDYIMQCYAAGQGPTEIAQNLFQIHGIKTNKQNVDDFIERQLKQRSAPKKKISKVQIQQIAAERVAAMMPAITALLIKEVSRAIEIAAERTNVSDP